MLGKIMCLLNRHRPKAHTQFRGEKGIKLGICRRCGLDIRFASSNRWVRKRTQLAERDLDARAALLANPGKSHRKRSSRKP
jgi:hypothetical protein